MVALVVGVVALGGGVVLGCKFKDQLLKVPFLSFLK